MKPPRGPKRHASAFTEGQRERAVANSVEHTRKRRAHADAHPDWDAIITKFKADMARRYEDETQTSKAAPMKLEIQQRIADIITDQRPDINSVEADRIAHVIITNLHITTEDQDRVVRMFGLVPKHRFVTPWEANS